MRILTLLIGLSLGSLLLGCGEDKPPPPKDEAQQGMTSGFQWAILPPEAGKDLYGDWGPYFRPDTPDVRKAISGVLGALRAEMAREDLPEYVDTKIWREMLSSVLAKIPQYRCQVIGVERKDGKPFLFLNFVHEQSFTEDEKAGPEYVIDWLRKPVLVDDGGDWYWQAKYVPEDGTYEDIAINGEA